MTQLSDKERAEIALRLARCRQLLAAFPEGVNAEHLSEWEVELLHRLRKLEGEPALDSKDGTRVKSVGPS